jgi:hypothetical protein
MPLINLNTASPGELRFLGFTDREITLLLARQGNMRRGSDIPFDISGFDGYVTLFTNANAASVEEWLSLSGDMTAAFAVALSNAAARQPFGSMAELEAFFGDYGHGVLFNRISRWLVLR